MFRRLLRVTSRALPSAWRETVSRDLEDEARNGRWSAPWQLWQTLRVALALQWMFARETVMSDLRYAVRALLHARWFTIGAILTFALGIGVNVAVFSAVDRLLFRALPYAHPESLVLLRSCDRTTGVCSAGSFPAAVAFALSQGSPTLQDVAAAGFVRTMVRRRGDEAIAPLMFVNVSPRLLRAVGVRPRIGRDISDAEIASKTVAAWLSDDAWRTTFGADPTVVGSTIWSGNTPVAVLGVLPAGFIPPDWGGQYATWTGLVVEYDGWTAAGPTGRMIAPFARLKPGVPLAAAQAEVTALASATPPDPRNPNLPPESLRVDPIQSSLFSKTRPYLWLVMLAAGAVLLIACTNLAGLLLARGRRREHQAAISTALGASPGRLMAGPMLESLLVCTAGAAAAVVGLELTANLVSREIPPLFSRYAENVNDLRVLVYCLAATAGCTIVAGVIPGWRLARTDLLPLLQKGTRGGGHARVRGGRVLLAVEAGVGAVLVLGALLALRSFVHLAQDDLGFQPEGLYYVRIALTTPPATRADVFDAEREHISQAVDVLRTMPGVRAAASGDYVPGPPEAPVYGFSKDVRPGYRVQVSPDYFTALGMPLLAGRAITDTDVAAHAPVVVMNILAVRRLWPGLTPQQAVGQVWNEDGEAPRTVVGVTGVVRRELGGTDAAPAAYLPMGAAPTPWTRTILRVPAGQVLQAGAVDAFLGARLPGVRVTSLTYAPDLLEPNLRDPRFRAMLLSIFALTGLGLAALGLYAMASFEVAARRYEMGVRLTLGATPRRLQQLVIRESVRPVVFGAIAGLVVSWWLATSAQAFLYQTDGRDLRFYVPVVGVLVLSAALAAWLPARRAARTDPAIVLRAQ